MNIIEAYIKYNGRLVIFVSGISGCGKTSLAKKISKKFDIPLIEQFNYYKKGYDDKVTLPDGTEHINYNSDNAIDWTRLDKDIKDKESKGVIVTGFALVDDKLDVKPDYHIHISMSKQECIDRRRTYLEKHKDKYKEEHELIDTDTERLKMNRMIFPYYLETVKRSKINKFMNIKEGMDDDNIWDSAWDILIGFISGRVDKLYKQWVETNRPENNRDLDEDYEEAQKIKDGPIQFLDRNNEYEESFSFTTE